MKIAVACIKENVAEHFGHCESFKIYEVEDKKVISKKTIANPGHEKGFLPKFLNEKGVNVVISGGMGEGAINLLKEENIEILTGNLGNSDEIVEKYLCGKLNNIGDICDKHAFKSECGSHKE